MVVGVGNVVVGGGVVGVVVGSAFVFVGVVVVGGVVVDGVVVFVGVFGVVHECIVVGVVRKYYFFCWRCIN